MKKHIYSTLLTVLSSAALLMPAQSSAKEELIDKVVAVVNDEIILKSELSTKLYEQSQALAAQNIPVKNPEALREKVLDSMILEMVQLDRAKQIGLQAEDAEINQQLQTLAEQNNMSLFQLRNRLNIEVPEGFQRIRNNIKNQVIIQKLREKEVISQAYVTESEIQNFLKRQRLAKSNIQVRLNHILISLPESATPSQRQASVDQARLIKAKLTAGEDFSQLAVRHSSGGKALQGGDLGWLAEDEVPTFFANELEKLSPGQVSEVIESPSGFHLIKLADKKDLQNNQAKTEYRLYRFVVPSDQKDLTKVPDSVIKLAKEMDSIQDFQALFKTYEDIPAQLNQDSDLGWRTLSRIPAVIRNDVAKLNSKNALPPLMTDNGWMILYLDDIRETTEVSEEDRKKAVQSIRSRKANEMFDLWLRRLRDEAYIQIK